MKKRNVRCIEVNPPWALEVIVAGFIVGFAGSFLANFLYDRLTNTTTVRVSRNG